MMFLNWIERHCEGIAYVFDPTEYGFSNKHLVTLTGIIYREKERRAAIEVSVELRPFHVYKPLDLFNQYFNIFLCN